MKRVPYLLLPVLLLLCTCSDDDDPTSPNVDPVTDFELTITCRCDAGAGVSQAIDATAGGSLSVVGADGVRYSLTIPPNALAHDTVITIKPLDSFAVSGDLLTNGLDTAGQLCPPGIICEPSGLLFDSTVTLTIQVPVGYGHSTDSTITAAYFDTAQACLMPVPTTYDSVSATYSCDVSHFSGYTVIDIPSQATECDMLLGAYQPWYDAAFASAGTEFFTMYGLRMYEVKASNIRRDPHFSGQAWIACPSFDDRVDSDITQLLLRHWQRIQEDYAEFSADNHRVPELITLYQQLLYLSGYAGGTIAAPTYVEVIQALQVFISDRLRAVAAHGQQLCQQVDCRGKDYLLYAFQLGSEGWIVTPAYETDGSFLAQLSTWIDDCCSDYLDVSITIPGPRVIKRYAFDPAAVEGDQYAYICSLAVHVDRPGGTPAAGVPVNLFRDGETSIFGRGSTDTNGIASFLLSPKAVDWSCQTEESMTLSAKAYESQSGEWFESDGSVTVTFINQAVTTSINYVYTYDWDSGDEPQLHWTASLSGSGTGPARTLGTCASACVGLMQRNYTGSEVFWNGSESQYESLTWNTVGPDSVYACRSNIEVHSVNLPTLGRSFDFIFGASVSLGGSIFAGLIYENNSGRVDTIRYGLSDTVWPEEPLSLLAGSGGVIGDTTWTWSGEGVGSGSQVTATLQISIRAEE